MKRWFLAGTFCVGMTGCFHATYHTGAKRATPSHSVSGTDHFFLYGLANDASVDTAAACPGAVPSRVQVRQTFLDGFIAVVTLGIYTPRTHEVWCAAPEAAAAPISPVPAGGRL